MPRIITPPQPSIAQRIAAAPHSILRGMVQQWTQAFLALWGRPHPVPPEAAPEAIKARYLEYEATRRSNSEAILAELGTEAAALMEDSAELVGFFLPRLPEPERNQLLALIGTKPATTTHPDGTVTID